MNRESSKPFTVLRPDASKASKVPNYLAILREAAGPSDASDAFGRTPSGKVPPEAPASETEGPTANNRTSDALDASDSILSLFHPAHSGYATLFSRVLGCRVLITRRDDTIVPSRLADLPRYSWPEIERILALPRARAVLQDVQRAKAVFPDSILEDVGAEP